MPSLRRLTASLAGLLLLQLTLLGAEWPCGSHVRSLSSPHAVTTMASSASHDASPVRTPDDDCDGERTAGDCATMPSCLTTLTLPASFVTIVALLPTSDALRDPVSIHSQPTTGPDVPPPRG